MHGRGGALCRRLKGRAAVPLSPSEKSLQTQAAAHTSWGNTKNRTERTAKPRKAFEDKFLADADGDPVRAESLRKAYFAELTRKSIAARRLRAEGGAK
jgi:hypothetical protein